VAAKLYVAGALRAAAKVGTGRGPMNHLWPLLRVTD
jgi:hydroxymethylpyrimidine/phosphomethylpyrimidine kinase